MTHQQRKEMAARMKARRYALGLKQERFAEMIDISNSSYTKIENAFQQPSLDTLIQIAKKLDLSLDFLVWGIPGPTDQNVSLELFNAVRKMVDPAKLVAAREVFEQLVNMTVFLSKPDETENFKLSSVLPDIKETEPCEEHDNE